jgi:hypothetical protein
VISALDFCSYLLSFPLNSEVQYFVFVDYCCYILYCLLIARVNCMSVPVSGIMGEREREGEGGRVPNVLLCCSGSVASVKVPEMAYRLVTHSLTHLHND